MADFNTDKSGAFMFASDLGDGLSDALEYMVNSPAVAGQGLPIHAYTAGDTTGESEKSLPVAALTTLPAKVTRRYSPVKASDISPGAPAAPPPSFSVVNAPTAETRQQVYPIPLARTPSVDALFQEQAAKTQKTRSLLSDNTHLVPTDSNAAALLERLGRAVPKEAVSSANFTERGAAKYGASTDVVMAQNVNTPVSLTVRAIEVAPQAEDVPASRLAPAVTIPVGFSKTVFMAPPEKSLNSAAPDMGTAVKKKMTSDQAR
jgi:hypothetical protein